jgi:hypothetical protein
VIRAARAREVILLWIIRLDAQIPADSLLGIPRSDAPPYSFGRDPHSAATRSSLCARNRTRPTIIGRPIAAMKAPCRTTFGVTDVPAKDQTSRNQAAYAAMRPPLVRQLTYNWVAARSHTKRRFLEALTRRESNRSARLAPRNRSAGWRAPAPLFRTRLSF